MVSAEKQVAEDLLMRGSDPKQPVIFSYVSLEVRVPKDHPLRSVRSIVDRVLEDHSGDFWRMYSAVGRPSIPPEQMLRALLIQVSYSVPSERELMEQLEFNQPGWSRPTSSMTPEASSPSVDGFIFVQSADFIFLHQAGVREYVEFRDDER